MRNQIYRYLIMTLGCIIMAISVNAFYMPHKLISGGITGIAVILYYMLELPMGATTFILNIPLFVIAYRYMDKQYILSTLFGMIVFSIALDAFYFISDMAPFVNDTLLACIAGGVTMGMVAFLIYLVWGSAGWTDSEGGIIFNF